MNANDLHYSNLQSLIAPYDAKGYTESRAFLNWFLEQIHRLDDTTAADAICDDYNDKGIDGIYVDTTLEEIQFFQSKVVQNPNRTLGDTVLKEFAGGLDQFQTPQNIDLILQDPSTSKKLLRLLSNLKIRDLVESGYSVRGILVTNNNRDLNAITYLAHRSDITVFDADAIAASYVDVAKPDGVPEIADFDTSSIGSLAFVAGTNVVMMPALASDLVKLSCIQGGTIFAKNVRLGLGNTKVNQDIESSIDDPKQHKFFPLYHNGITILAETVLRTNDKVTIENYSVVNGAQSLTAIYKKRDHISSDLRINVRIIEVPLTSPMAPTITYRSNNQNAVKARDQKSNSPIQTRLQQEVADFVSGTYALAVKGGEKPVAQVVIDNELAGKMLLSFDLLRPWAAHQAYRIFDESFNEIFARPMVTGKRIILLHEIMTIIVDELEKLENRLFAHYSLTRFLVLYMVARVLQRDAVGQEMLKNVDLVFDTTNGLPLFRQAIVTVISDLVVDLNAEANEAERADAGFDYKNLLKSPNQARSLAEAVMTSHFKLVDRNRVPGFGAEWIAGLKSATPA